MSPVITSTWVSGRQFVHHSATGHALLTDTPVEAGGDNRAPTPLELVVMGLAGCTGVDVVSILEGMRQPPRGVQVTAEYERAEEHPRRITRIALRYRVEGDLEPAKVERAVALSKDKYCSVAAMLAGQVEISHAIEIVP